MGQRHFHFGKDPLATAQDFVKRGRKTSRERDGFPHTKTKYRHGDRDHTPKTMRAWRPLLWLEVCHSRSLLFPLSYLSCLPPLKLMDSFLKPKAKGEVARLSGLNQKSLNLLGH